MEIGEAIPEDPKDHKMMEPQEPIETSLRRTPIRGNHHGYESSYEKLKGMALQQDFIEREKGQSPTIAIWPCYVTSLTRNLPPIKRL